MEKRGLTCISCPLGCDLEAEVTADTVTVTGNRCEKGVVYAKAEVLNPQRVVTSNVLVEGGLSPLVSVKTSAPIPKGLIGKMIQELKNVRLHAPIRIGQVLIRDLFGTGVDVIATRAVELLPAAQSGPSPVPISHPIDVCVKL